MRRGWRRGWEEKSWAQKEDHWKFGLQDSHKNSSTGRTHISATGAALSTSTCTMQLAIFPFDDLILWLDAELAKWEHSTATPVEVKAIKGNRIHKAVIGHATIPCSLMQPCIAVECGCGLLWEFGCFASPRRDSLTSPSFLSRKARPNVWTNQIPLYLPFTIRPCRSSISFSLLPWVQFTQACASRKPYTILEIRRLDISS